jgi:hypothetical protein
MDGRPFYSPETEQAIITVLRRQSNLSTLSSETEQALPKTEQPSRRSQEQSSPPRLSGKKTEHGVVLFIHQSSKTGTSTNIRFSEPGIDHKHRIVCEHSCGWWRSRIRPFVVNAIFY